MHKGELIAWGTFSGTMIPLGITGALTGEIWPMWAWMAIMTVGLIPFSLILTSMEQEKEEEAKREQQDKDWEDDPYVGLCDDGHGTLNTHPVDIREGAKVTSPSPTSPADVPSPKSSTTERSDNQA